MKKPQIHQFHSGSATGDAVTNSLFYVQRLLRELGFESEIYVEHAALDLKDRLFHFSQYTSNPENVLLVHHSMGHDQLAWLQSLDDKKILLYHNVTPPKYFPEGSSVQAYAIKGRQMLHEMKSMLAAAVAVSEENARELCQFGYANPAVLPILLDQGRAATGVWNDAIVRNESRNNIILFVGRIAANKCQHDLVSLAERLKCYTDKNYKLVLVGGYDTNDPYYRALTNQIKAAQVGHIVHLTGKVSEEDLLGWYRAATVYVSMSEHEGFGVPFLESMLFDLPVVAYKCHAIPYVLENAGIMFDTKNMDQMGAIVAEILDNRDLRRALVVEQRKRLAAYAEPMLYKKLASVLQSIGVSCPVDPKLLEPPGYPPYTTRKWQIEGPFETSYSLAVVNRNLALALSQGVPGSVTLFPTEGPGDYTPDPGDLAKYPETVGLYLQSRKGSQADIVVRNLWPPRYRDMDGLVNLASFAWEESSVPPEIVNEINTSVDGVITPSEYCKKIYVNNGVKVPVRVVGHGWEHLDGGANEIAAQDEQLPGEFRFLHVSSAFPRKGVASLLNAFEMAFNDDPGATLILKTFPNPHNEVAPLLDNLSARNPALNRRILWINKDLSGAALKKLYQNCHAFVSATKGEGFGLPMLEAMAMGLPVIVTSQGGHSDFCTNETAWLVKCSPAVAATHLNSITSCWHEPDVDHLAAQMKTVRHATPEARAARISRAKQLTKNTFTWKTVASRTRAFAESLLQNIPYSKTATKVAFVTTWNTKCGIATYSGNLVRQLQYSPGLELQVFADTNVTPYKPDEPWVTRNWRQSFADDSQNTESLEETLLSRKFDSVIFQFNFGFFNVRQFARIIDNLADAGTSVIIIFHATNDINKPGLKISLSEIKQSLARCRRLLVHSMTDLLRFAKWGLEKNTALFPHGIAPRECLEKSEARERHRLAGAPLIATFGYCLPQKGLVDAIEAFALLKKKRPNAKMLMLNAYYSPEASEETATRCKAAIKRLNLADSVTLRLEFLPEHHCLELLDACDIALFPYKQTDESSSAAVRTALQSRCAVICNPVAIFEDVKNYVSFTDSPSPEGIARAMDEMLQNQSIADELMIKRRLHAASANWSLCADRLEAIVLDAGRTTRVR